MVLLLAVTFGLFAGLTLAFIQGRAYKIDGLRFTWLSMVAFLPQIIVLYMPSTRKIISKEVTAAILIGSLATLLVFTWLNRKLPGMRVLSLGLVLNLIVILANGGFMPINPETIEEALPAASNRYQLKVGERFGAKDILLTKDETKLEWLADRYLMPSWFPFQAAFSIGDIIIALGIFWLLVRANSDSCTYEKELQPL